jgi:lipopolysaccharide/colanic/teichoic acid biosynthesis glycosyltransferase
MGLHGKRFKIIKFRTMVEAPESYLGPRVTAQDDPRITPIGRWLRDTKLNELPQLWNVLKGDMSLVGPRPEDPEITQRWNTEARREVLSVRPGITSPASVLYRDEENLLQSSQLMDTYLGSILPSKLRLDQLYVRHRSFWLDLDVLFWTALVILPRLGKFNPPEGLLFQGPFTRFVNRYLSWFVIDTFVSLAAISLSGLFFRLYAPLDIGWTRAVLIAILYSFLFSLTCAILKVNRITWSEASGEDILALVPATFLATLLAVVINAVLPNPEQAGQPFVPFGMVFLATLLAFLGFVFVRFRRRITVGLEARWLSRWSQIPITRERALVVGGGESGQIANILLSMSSYGNRFQIVGFVDDDLYKQDTRIRGIEVLGKTADIPDLVQKFDIGLIFFAIHKINAVERNQLLEICAKTPARTVLFPDLPAALSTLVLGGGDKAALEGVSEDSQPTRSFLPEIGENLPCHLCLIKHSPIEIDSWLKEMEKTIDSGDLESIRSQIAERRTILQPDVQKQKLAGRNVHQAGRVTGA